MEKNVFCKGLLCSKYNRNAKCNKCGVYLCGVCNHYSIKDNKKINWCINCYYSVNWASINADFDNMINKLFKDNEKKSDIPLINYAK